MTGGSGNGTTNGTRPNYALTKEQRELALPKLKNFVWSETDEPHATRRRQILAKYPQIRQLFKKEPRTALVVLLVFCAQLMVAQWAQNAPWGWLLIVAYVFGGTANHSLQMASHELSHNLCWDEDSHNKLTAIFGNFVTGLPSAILFQRYHMEHHQFQGCDGWDTDVPTAWEGLVFKNALTKTMWVILQPIFYCFRPMLIKPKKAGFWEILNFVSVFLFDIAVFFFIGGKGLAYLIIGTLMGFGLHPASGHLIAEHFVTSPGQETYSYYGIMNRFNFNVGYHNEHHDFPRIPWSNLPKVKKIAPEFYETLPHHTSYLSVFWRYITDPLITPFARMKRKAPSRIFKAPTDTPASVVAAEAENTNTTATDTQSN
jgi:sphingolipid delta-4 desaturase